MVCSFLSLSLPSLKCQHSNLAPTKGQRKPHNPLHDLLLFMTRFHDCPNFYAVHTFFVHQMRLRSLHLRLIRLYSAYWTKCL
jgi:hypothetical protein